MSHRTAAPPAVPRTYRYIDTRSNFPPAPQQTRYRTPVTETANLNDGDFPDAERTPLPPVIATLTRKGGVGKTTLTALVASALASDDDPDRRRKVLVVDLDSQGNLAPTLGVTDNDEGRGLVNAWANGDPLTPTATSIEGLDVIPGGAVLDWMERVLAVDRDRYDTALARYEKKRRKTRPDPPFEEVGLRQALAGCDTGTDYDLILLDGPPGTAVTQKAVLLASDGVIVPVGYDPKAWSAFMEMLAYSAAHRDSPQSHLADLRAVIAQDVFADPSRAAAAEADVRRRAGNEHLGDDPVSVFATTWARLDVISTTMSTSDGNPFHTLEQIAETSRWTRRKNRPDGGHRGREGRIAATMIRDLANEVRGFAESLASTASDEVIDLRANSASEEVASA